jgi:tetratricopeptide (TPR) repeat protein
MTPKTTSNAGVPMRRARRLILACAIALLALPATASTAYAAGPTPPQSAEQLANEAYELHQQGRFAESIATYVKVYEISKASAVLYNIAIIYDRKLHERELAAEYYRRYLGASDAEPALVKKAAERLEALKKEAEATPPAAPVQPAPAPAPPAAPVSPPTTAVAPPPSHEPPETVSRGSGWRTGGIMVGALGLGALSTSVVLGVLAKSRNDDANKLCNGAACTTQEGVSLAHDAGTFATASTVTFAAGLGALGLGVTMYLLAPHGASAAAQTGSARLEPQVGPGSAAILLRGSF